MPDTQHSQVESSQVEKISLQAFRSQLEAKRTQELPLPTGEGRGEGSTFNSATTKQLQKSNYETDSRRVKQKHVAFTLAEVLITLGIIGVVAAMTLPALLVKTKTSEYSARLKKFYSTMNQAIKMSELDNGPCEYWDYEKLTYLSNGADSPQEEKDSVAKESSDKASAFLDKYIRPYMKGERSDDFNWVTETKGVEIKAPGIKFHDGSAVYVKTGDCFDFAFDANGSAPPNERGKDQFIFMYCNKEHNAVKGQCFTPYWTKYTKNKPRQYWIEQCANQPYYCSALLFIDGWEFKKDYPFKVK